MIRMIKLIAKLALELNRGAWALEIVVNRMIKFIAKLVLELNKGAWAKMEMYVFLERS